MTVDQLTPFALFMLSIACGVLGWFARQLWSAVQELRRDLSALEVQITRDYVRMDRLDKLMQPIMEQLNRIEQALTHKLDKP